MRAFCKWCRAKKLTTFHPEGLHVPAGARPKGKKVLQPDALITLFRVDTTLYRGKRVHDDFIHAYRFQVLTACARVNWWACAGPMSRAAQCSSPGP